MNREKKKDFLRTDSVPLFHIPPPSKMKWSWATRANKTTEALSDLDG